MLPLKGCAMTANEQPKTHNFTRVKDVPEDRIPPGGDGHRVIVDEYHTVCMCPDCLTLLEAPGASVPTCSCGSTDLPVGADCRLTVKYADCIRPYVYLFVNWKSPNRMQVIVLSETGSRKEYNLIPNASYMTDYYEVKDLDRTQRMMTEQYGRLVSFLIMQFENIT
jgi:hypothetical protein